MKGSCLENYSLEMFASLTAVFNVHCAKGVFTLEEH